MAKSRSFFGLRKGSTKSLTYSIFEGIQVTKERISYMTNPQTYAQGSQRALFAAAAKFYAVMKFVLDHSWEGVAYGTRSQANFMKLALASGIGTSLAKGDAAYPFNYPISRGTLPSIAWEGMPPFSGTVLADRFASKIRVIEDNFEDMTILQLLGYNAELMVGDQVSFIGAEIVNGVMMPLYYRFVIPSETSQLISSSVVERVYPDGTVYKLGGDEVFQGTSTGPDNKKYLTVKSQLVTGIVNNCTWVLSRKDSNGKWLRSNSNFTLLDEENAGAGIESYTSTQKRTISVVDSERFLNDGETQYKEISKQIVKKVAVTSNPNQQVTAIIKVAAKLVKQSDGSVKRIIMTDENGYVLGGLNGTPHGFVFTGALVEGAAESARLVLFEDIIDNASEEYEDAGWATSNFVSVPANSWYNAAASNGGNDEEGNG